ncbi:MAG: bifunctional adenosylcobinamide kinase/adenosylcobinamide-phosphate guanylyltransferase [Ferruginibacter sp.]|nr:bifunctional adenosylcobinamide kinase/adenosylcobinamide-phosphate guanylyltransferase [Cytophagales bacterium]
MGRVAQPLHQFKGETDALRALPGRFIAVTNEPGMRVHAETAVGRAFTDLRGRVNQYAASRADAVTLVVSGLPMPIKTPPR